MSSLLEYYKILGVNVGAGIADVTASYKRLCRMYHPDVSDDPEAEEQMKQINIAYTVLREKLKREAAFHERQSHLRATRRHTSTDTRTTWDDTHTTKTDAHTTGADNPHTTKTDAHATGANAHATGADDAHATHADANATGTGARANRAGARAGKAETRTHNYGTHLTGIEAEKEASLILQSYFKAISLFDFSSAYSYLSAYDRRHISRESFVKWREAVARLHPMHEFRISGGLSVMPLPWGDGKTLYARRFRIAVTEEDVMKGETIVGAVEKLVIYENGVWRVFLGYKGVGELTRTFDEQFETKRRQDVTKRMEEYYTELYPEYNMLSMSGMRKAASRELYRKRRYGGAMTFATISIKARNARKAGQDELLRMAARTIVSLVRETDVSAYAGDGVFAILFIELKKKNASSILERLIGTIRKSAGIQLGARAEIEYTYESWSTNSPADMDSFNTILKKFHKKM